MVPMCCHVTISIELLWQSAKWCCHFKHALDWIALKIDCRVQENKKIDNTHIPVVRVGWNARDQVRFFHTVFLFRMAMRYSILTI